MFFVLSKILDVALSPLFWALVLVALGVRFRDRAPKRAAKLRRWWLPAVGIGVLYVFSIEPVANALVRGVESGASAVLPEGRTYDAVILLGGMVDELATEETGQPTFNDNVERMLESFDLLRTGRAKSVVISSGTVVADHPVEAPLIAHQLERWGIAPDRLVVEDRALNTRENAVYVAQIVRERGWHDLVIVTSAYHLRRARECFNAVGLPVDAVAVDFRSYDPSHHSGSWLPRARTLAVSEMAIREWFGRIVYRLRGYAKATP